MSAISKGSRSRKEVIATAGVVIARFVEFRVNVLPTDQSKLINHGDVGAWLRRIGYY